MVIDLRKQSSGGVLFRNLDLITSDPRWALKLIGRILFTLIKFKILRLLF